MKPFQSFTMVKQPLEEVWIVMRDRLPDIAATMEDLESIEVLERTFESGGRLSLLNRWKAKQQIPAMLQGKLGASSVYWLDRALWDNNTHVCSWSIEPSVLPGHIECCGTTTYTSAMAGRGTRVTFEGYFNLKAGFLEGLPVTLELALSGFVETIVSSLIPRNLSRAISSASDLISNTKIVTLK
jgi:uncharacterized membrane protein